MTCIYLDQFAASNLFDEPSSPLWENIKDLLIQKYMDGKIICPLPSEHFLESANKSREKALNMHYMFYRLSRGMAILPEAIATANILTALVRDIKIDSKTFCYQLKPDNVLEFELRFDTFKGKSSLTQLSSCGSNIWPQRIESLVTPTSFS